VESTKKRQDCKKSESVVISQDTSDLSLPFRRIRGDYEIHTCITGYGR